MIYRMVYVAVLFLFVLVFIFFNLGKWIDVTQEPAKSDIIVCLGGGTIERVKKSLELFEDGYSDKDVFLLLGESWYNQPYIAKHYSKLPIVIDESPKNTREEILYIKEYMRINGYKSALIVTDPPHSRRVAFLMSLHLKESNENVQFRIIGSDVPWWNKEYYYHDKRAITFVKNESLRIIYRFITYGF